MARLIGTAGHVDHGKTTLIRALTGIDADRLPQEKQRGMTIEIGFAHIHLPEAGDVSIVDVPGHEKFVTNMLVGALGINVALLCVSADEGVMPQTREHVQILNLLPVDRMVVAITRCDLVDAETLELAMADVRQFLGETRFGGAPVLPVSALKGDGLDALRSALDQALMDGDAPLPGASWYLPIDRAFSVKGHGVVVTGTLAQGRVGVGQQAVLQPGHQEVRVRGIHIHGEVHDGSERGRRTAVNLGGVKLEEVRRGMALGAAEALFETTCMDAELVWTSPPKHGLRVRVAIGAAEAIGRLFLTDGSPSLGQLRLEEPVAAALGQPIIVRRYSPPDLIGGGRVTVPQAKPRRRSEASSTVQASGDEAAILEVLEGAPAGVATEEIARRLGKSVQALGTVFEGLSRSGAIKGFAGLWMTQEAFDVSSQRLLDSLRHLHELNPAQATIPREKAVHEAGLPWAGKPLDRILSAMAAEGRVVVAGTLIRDPEFKVRLSARQREFLDRVKDVMNRRGVNAPSAAEIAQEVAAPPQAVHEILRIGVEAREVVRVAEGLLMTSETLEGLRSTVAAGFAGRPFSASEFRDLVGTTRKYAIPILEFFDATRFTQRIGDNRVLVASS